MERGKKLKYFIPRLIYFLEFVAVILAGDWCVSGMDPFLFAGLFGLACV